MTRTELNTEECLAVLRKLSSLKTHIADAEQDTLDALQPFRAKYGDAEVKRLQQPLCGDEKTPEVLTIRYLTLFRGQLEAQFADAERLEEHWTKQADAVADEEYWNREERRTYTDYND